MFYCNINFLCLRAMDDYSYGDCSYLFGQPMIPEYSVENNHRKELAKWIRSCEKNIIELQEKIENLESLQLDPGLSASQKERIQNELLTKEVELEKVKNYLKAAENGLKLLSMSPEEKQLACIGECKTNIIELQEKIENLESLQLDPGLSAFQKERIQNELLTKEVELEKVKNYLKAAENGLKLLSMSPEEKLLAWISECEKNIIKLEKEIADLSTSDSHIKPDGMPNDDSRRLEELGRELEKVKNYLWYAEEAVKKNSHNNKLQPIERRDQIGD